jgi:hypothetical protein
MTALATHVTGLPVNPRSRCRNARVAEASALQQRFHSTAREVLVRCCVADSPLPKRPPGDAPGRTRTCDPLLRRQRAPVAVYCRLWLRPLGEQCVVPSCCALLRFAASIALPHDPPAFTRYQRSRVDPRGLPHCMESGSRGCVGLAFRAKQERVCVGNPGPCSFQAEVSAGLAGPPRFAEDHILCGGRRWAVSSRLRRLSHTPECRFVGRRRGRGRQAAGRSHERALPSTFRQMTRASM